MCFVRFASLPEEGAVLDRFAGKAPYRLALLAESLYEDDMGLCPAVLYLVGVRGLSFGKAGLSRRRRALMPASSCRSAAMLFDFGYFGMIWAVAHDVSQ